MKISFSTLCCPRWNWREITATAHDLGYDGIEIRGVGKDISVPSVPEFGELQLEKTVEKLKSLSLSIPCLDSDCVLHIPDDLPRTHMEGKAYVDLAKKLSVPYVRVFSAPPVPQPEGNVDEGLVKEQARKLARYAGENGVTLLLETHGIWAQSIRLARLLKDIDHPNVAVLWDVHHPFRYFEEKPEETYGNLKPWIRHIHLKDSLLKGERIQYMLPGQGDVPLASCIHLLKEDGYDGFYSLEWVKRWDMSLEEPGIVLAHYANYIRSL